MPRGRGYTKVDLRHLLEDLRDAYPGGLEETILTELVANSLDAGASVIRVFADPSATTFRLEDNGRGMVWKELKQFHNLAASSKTRGAGIGFAGVGIKLALLAAREVVTESRRGKSHAASRWHLASAEFAPYEPIAPPGHVTEHGTAVVLHLNHGLSPLVDPGYVEHVIRSHFQPLVDPSFAEALAPLYPRGVRFEVNGRSLDPARQPATERAPLEVRIDRQRKASGLGHIERHSQPVAESLRGIAISTFGKVIRRGWDWLGILPAAPERITGILEVPSLSQALTLNKGDFVRTGPRGAVYLSYRRAIQEAVQAQLTRWGDARDLAQDTRRKVARPLERDLERVLDGLTDEFPLLASLVERQRGGQRQIALVKGGPRRFGSPASGRPAMADEGAAAAVAVMESERRRRSGHAADGLAVTRSRRYDRSGCRRRGRDRNARHFASARAARRGCRARQALRVAPVRGSARRSRAGEAHRDNANQHHHPAYQPSPRTRPATTSRWAWRWCWRRSPPAGATCSGSSPRFSPSGGDRCATRRRAGAG
jgi:hypothetical protein